MADTMARTAVWKGLNRMPYIGDGEMRDMKNLSSDTYPYLTTRKARVPFTLTAKVPSAEGELYTEVERLPAPSEEEVGKIYKITTSAPNMEYVSGKFYHKENGEWTEYKYDDWWLGSTNNVIGDTLVDKKFVLLEYSEQRYPKGYNRDGDYILYNPECCEGDEAEFVYKRYKVKYLGENSGMFEKGKSYAYCVYVKAHWMSGTWNNGTDGGNLTEIPAATSTLAAKRYYFKYTGQTNEEFTNGRIYKCVVSGRVYWEECEHQYATVSQMPDEGGIVRFCSTEYGAPVNNAIYVADVESNDENFFLYYRTDSSAIASAQVGYLPEATEGAIYKYIGVSAEGEFAKCYNKDDTYDWEIVEHPEVSREVTLKDYLDNYDGCGLTEIVEIGTFSGNLAALIVDGNGEYKLFYDKMLWPVSNISDESGKKLVTVGNRLVVGESGCYLHLKETKGEDGIVSREIEFTEQSNAFSYSFNAKNFPHGNGGEREKLWEAYSDEDDYVTFVLYEKWGESSKLKALYEGLKNPGTDFSVYAKRVGTAHRQYLEVESSKFEEKKLIQAWVVGEQWHYDYANKLSITAKGAWEEFDWYHAAGDTLVFESTDPHYYDVVAWKKRLWGYSGNVLHGTVADIWDEFGVVDWNTGDNTQTEAISQPLWQGNDITGVAALMSGLVYFKEDNISVVQGNYPAIMSSDTIPCRGLPAENRRSVAVGNESVYYLGRGGVMRFGGEIPRCISSEARIQGTEAVAATDGAKYWLSIKESNGEYALYVYDISYGLWHKEDNTKVSSFAVINGNMHMATGTDIYNLNGYKEDVEWECELWYDEGTYNRKKYKQINVRGDVGDCELWLKADDDEWKFISNIKGNIATKLIPFDCVELSLKLKGKGACEIKSVDRIYEVVV